MSAKSISSSLSKAASLSSSSLSSLASVSSKSALSSSSSLSKAAASSLSSASSLASKSSASVARVASASLSSASASASSYATSSSDQSTHSGTSYLTYGLSIFGVLIALLAVALGGLYVSGEGEHIFVSMAKKFWKAKAHAEVKALENVGEGQAQGFLKDQLKKNPILGEGELNQIAPGLGHEATREGLGGVSEKLGGLGGIGNLKKL